MRNRSLSLFVALTWLLVTTVLLCLPGATFPSKKWFDEIGLDKWIHIGLFAVLVFLWCRFVSLVQPNARAMFVQIFAYFLLYGIAMEFVQKYYIPNRSFDITDMIADGAGGAIGLLFSLKLLQKNRPL